MTLLPLRIECPDPQTLTLQLPQFGTLRLPLANCFLTLGTVSQDTDPLALQVHLFVPGLLDLGPLYAPQVAALQSHGVPWYPQPATGPKPPAAPAKPRRGKPPAQP